MADLAELNIESRTQSAETIKKILEDSGYGSIETTETTDAAPPPAAEEVAVAPAGTPGETIPPASDPDLGDTAGDGTDETGHTPAAGGEPAPHEPKKAKGGFARKLERQAVELDSLKATLAEMNRKLAEKPAALPMKPAEEASTVIPVDDDPEPVMDADEEWEPFNARHTRWLVRDERRQVGRAQQEREANEVSARKSTAEETARLATEAERTAAEERWTQSRERLKAVHPDSEEVFTRLLDPKTTHGTVAMGLVVRDYEEVGELLYWLGTHPEEETRIMAKTQLPDNFAQLGPRAQQRAIRVVEDAAREEYDRILSALPAAPGPDAPAPGTDGRRETPVAAAPLPPAQAQVPRPKAAPPKPVGHRGGAVTKRYPEDYTQPELRALSMEDVRRLRNMQNA